MIVSALQQRLSKPPNTNLVIANAPDSLGDRLRDRGFLVATRPIDEPFNGNQPGPMLQDASGSRSASDPSNGYDSIVIVDGLETLEREPALLDGVRSHLATRGRLLLVHPSLRSFLPSQEVTAALYEHGFAIMKEQSLSDGAAPDDRCAYQVVVAMADEFTVRSYCGGDEREILELFQKCFSDSRSLDHWIWKYRSNPYGREKISVAVADDESIVAHYAGYPCQFYDTTGETPRTILAYQNGDTMTADRVRTVGRGKTSLLYRTTRHHFARFCEGKVGFAYGYNVNKLQRYYTRLVEGSRFFDSVPYWRLDVDAASLVAGLDAPATEYHMEKVERLDRRWDVFFHEIAQSYGVLVKRDVEYLRWRYFDCPDADYRMYAVFHSHQLIGWGVFRQRNERLVWGDSLFSREHLGAVRPLLSYALSQPEHSHTGFIEGWYSRHPARWTDAIVEAGFTRQSEPNDLGMIYRCFTEPDPYDLFHSRLYYTMGDSDLF